MTIDMTQTAPGTWAPALIGPVRVEVLDLFGQWRPVLGPFDSEALVAALDVAPATSTVSPER
jgi:hypothetical protein